MNNTNKHTKPKTHPLWFVILIISLCGILCSIAIQYFIVPAATVPTEVMGVTMGITSTIFNYGTRSYLILFWSLYFIALVPFVLFGYFKVGKRFTYLTLLFTAVSTIFGLFLSAMPDSVALWKIFGNHGDIHNSFWLRFVYSSLGSALYATGLGFGLRMGASSGGTDFIAKWISNKKNIHISFMLVTFAVLTLILATCLFEIIGIQHKLSGIAYSKINYLQLFITFSFSVWQCILGPIIIYFIYKKNYDAEFTVTKKLKNNFYLF